MTRGAILMVAVALVALVSVSSAFPSAGHQQLDPHFYDHSCPEAQQIVASIVGKAQYQDPRMAASLLRLHFHDCFVKAPPLATSPSPSPPPHPGLRSTHILELVQIHHGSRSHAPAVQAGAQVHDVWLLFHSGGYHFASSPPLVQPQQQVLAILMFSGACAAASVMIFFMKDVNFCAKYWRLPCS